MPHNRARANIIVGGVDVTAQMDPYLISLIVVDKFGTETDTCDIELDDTEARMQLPKPGETVSVSLGLESSGVGNVFDGTITEVESGGARSTGGGRRIWVHAESINNFGKGKEPINMHMGEGDPPDTDAGEGPPIPFSAFASKVAQAGGYSAMIDPALGAKTRSYWNVGGASPHHALQDLARQMGGFVKFMNDKVAIVSALGGMSAAGIAMGNVQAVWGKNLILWRVKPFIARPMYSGGKGDYFRIIKAGWQQVQGAFSNGSPFGGAQANAAQPYPGAGESSTQQSTEGLGADSTNERGAGYIMIDGNPNAKGGGMITLVGARPGVDGTYKISEAEHHYSRSSGYVTRCNLADPPEAGSSRLSGQGWTPPSAGA
jgi:phage protein D